MMVSLAHLELEFIGDVRAQQQSAARFSNNSIEPVGRRAPNSILC
jgi:hypothetical protein